MIVLYFDKKTHQQSLYLLHIPNYQAFAYYGSSERLCILCVNCIAFVSFYDFAIGFATISDSVVFFD
jgi:hypothetical protein